MRSSESECLSSEMSIPGSNSGEPRRTLTSAVYLFVSVLGLVSSSISIRSTLKVDDSASLYI